MTSSLPLRRLALGALLALFACDSASEPDLDASVADTVEATDTATAEDTATTFDTVMHVDTATNPDTATDPDTAADTVTDPDTAVDPDTTPVADTETVADTTAASDPWPDLSDQALRDALQAWTSAGHTPLGYDDARDEMYAEGGVDDHGGRIEGIYTGRTVDTNGSRTPDDNCELADGTPTTCDFNTEHTWARYHLRQALTEGTDAYYAAEGDIHHLFPSDADVNNARWHFEFGETQCAADGNCKIDEESRLGLRPGSDGASYCPTGNLDLDKDCVMWVRAERRGDIARAQFYMAVRYGMAIPAEMEAWLRGWSDEDPPDARERGRNDAAEAAQGNRNPFVDWPHLAARIADF